MKVDRLVSMILILLERERVGARALAALFEVSPRTVYRDMDAIARAGIPVRATSGVGGGFEIMPQYKLEKKVFSAGDLSAILTGLSGLATLIRGDELMSALAKVRSFIPAESAKDIERKAAQTQIDLTPWMGGAGGTPYLEILKTAIQENRLLSFTYMDQHGQQTARTAEPYQLVLKGNHWYWHAYCRLRNDYRLFKLSRTANLRLLETRFTPREASAPRLNLPDPAAAPQTEVTLRVHQSVMDKVLDDGLYTQIAPDGDAHYIVRLPFAESDYAYNYLFSLGDQCECLEPAPIRAEMKRRVCGLAALYER